MYFSYYIITIAFFISSEWRNIKNQIDIILALSTHRYPEYIHSSKTKLDYTRSVQMQSDVHAGTLIIFIGAKQEEKTLSLHLEQIFIIYNNYVP
jgi:hypothetical protein